MPGNIADAYVGIYPDTSKFAAALQAEIGPMLAAREKAVQAETAREQKLAAQAAAYQERLDIKTEATRQKAAAQTYEFKLRQEAVTDQLLAKYAAEQDARARKSADVQIEQARRVSTAQSGISRDLASLIGGSAGGAEGSRLGRLGATLTSFAAPVAALGVGLAVAGGEAVKFGTKYQAALATVKATTTITSQEFAGLDGQIRQLSVSYGENQVELAKAAQLIYSDGLKGAQAQQALAAAAEGARAGLGTVEQVANVLGPTLNAYADDGLTASHATDLLAKAAQEGHIPVGTFANSLGQLVGPASALGVKLPDLVATFATLSQTNPNQAQDVTSIRALITGLSRLEAPTQSAKDALKELNLTQTDLGNDLRSKGLYGTIQELSQANDRYAKANHGSNSAVLELLKNQRELTGFFGTTAGSALQRYTDNVKGLGAATGTAATSASIQLHTFQGDLDVVGAKFHNAEIAASQFLIPLASAALSGAVALFGDLERVVDPLGPTIELTVRTVEDLAKALAPVIDPVVEAGFVGIALGIRGIADVLNPVLSGLDDLAKFLGDNKDLVEALGIALGVTLVPRLLAASAAAAQFVLALADQGLAKAGEAISGIGDALAATNPLLLVAAAAVGVLAYNYEQGQKEAKAFADTASKLDPTLDVKSFASLDLFNEKLREQTGALDDQQAKFQQIKAALASGVGGVNLSNGFGDALTKQQEATQKSAQDQIAALQAIGKQYGLTNNDALKYASSLNVDLTSGTANAVRQFGLAQQAAKDTHDPLVRINTDLDTIGGTASTASDQVKAFQDALQGLLDPTINAERATITFRTDIRALAAAVKENGTNLKESGGAFSETTAKADELRTKIQGLVGDIESGATTQFQNLVQSGKSGADAFAQVSQSILANRDAILQQASSLGISKSQLDAYLNSLGFTSTGISDLATQLGVATNNVNDLNVGLNGLPSTVTTTIQVNLAGAGAGIIKGGNTVGSLPTVTTRGTGVRAMATGGSVPGQGDTDSVAALLTPGEFVITKPAAQALGHTYLEALNQQGGVRAYATGGLIPVRTSGGSTEKRGRSSRGRSGGRSGSHAAATVYVDPGTQITDESARKLYDTLKTAVSAGTVASATALDGKLRGLIGSGAKNLLGLGQSDTGFLRTANAQTKAVEKVYGTEVTLKTRLTMLNTKLKADQATLDSARTKAADYANTITNNSAGAFSLTNALNGSGAVSADSVTTFLQQQTAGAGQFRSNVDRLKQLGFSQSVLDQVESASPQDGAKLAQALAGSTSAQVSSINNGVASGAAFAGALGQSVSQDKYGAELAADTRQVATDARTQSTLQSQILAEQRAATKLLSTLASEITEAMRKPVAQAKAAQRAATPQFNGARR